MPTGRLPEAEGRTRLSDFILVELTDGTLRAYAFPSAADATSWHEECRREWNAGRSLVFYCRSRHGTVSDVLDGDEVAHLELADRESVEARGIACFSAVIYG